MLQAANAPQHVPLYPRGTAGPRGAEGGSLVGHSASGRGKTRSVSGTPQGSQPTHARTRLAQVRTAAFAETALCKEYRLAGAWGSGDQRVGSWVCRSLPGRARAWQLAGLAGSRHRGNHSSADSSAQNAQSGHIPGMASPLGDKGFLLPRLGGCSGCSWSWSWSSTRHVRQDDTP